MADLTTPVAPFDATAGGVNSLVPQATIALEPVSGRDMAVTVDQVIAWLEELSGWVGLRCSAWLTLSDVPPPAGVPSLRAQFVALARTVVENGAASYLMAARHPELARVNDSSYQHVLWQRYEAGIAQLEAWLDEQTGHHDPDGDGVSEPVGQVAASFPRPIFVDGIRW